MSLQSVAEDYFGSINPIARRMYEDMKEAKSAYENLWDTISEKEQKQILSESIILPEISIKYPPCEADNEQEFAVKFVLDDNNCRYRDEHSAPFSFKTRSQRDLCLFELPLQQTKKVMPKPKVKQRTPQSVQKIVDDFMDIQVSFPKDTCDSRGNSLPKTGLDFLDNW